MKTAFLLVFVVALAVFVGWRFSSSLRGTDFPDFYCAARMLAGGQGHQLYDVELQREYQARYAGRVGTLYIHPPFEAALYLVVAWLPQRSAYLLWFFLSLTFLGIAARSLAQDALPPWDWRLLFAASLTFIPALLCLAQGQDSLLLLLLIVLAFTNLRRSRAFSAGCWLGLGLFKFQLVLPLAFVLFLTGSKSARSGLAKGFGLVTFALMGLSAAISGWSVFAVYPKFLLHLQAQPFSGIFPQAMANFRGLAYFFFHRDDSPGAVTAICILSAAALVKVLTDWRHARPAPQSQPATLRDAAFDVAFSSTILFALVVSHHLNPHDLSLLLMPIALLLRRTLVEASRRNSANWIMILLLAVLFLPPLHALALKTNTYALVALPLLLLFLNTGFIHQHQSKN